MSRLSRRDRAFGCAVLCLLLFGCAAERAVRVTVVLRTAADDVCLVAREEGTAPRVAFAMAYPAASLPSPATLTFVAASSHAGAVDVTARGVLAGSFVGGATIVTPLTMQGTIEVTLPVERCRARTTASFGTRPGGTFAALRDPPRMIAGDYDGDGRDELLAIAADGSLAVLDAENVGDGSHRESELLASDGTLVTSGDLDVDCRLDVIAAAGSGALVVSSEDGASPPPVGSAPRDAAIGRVGRMSPVRIVIGGASGLSLVAPPGSMGGSTMLSMHPIDHVVAWDADGDGGSEIVATGAMGLLAFAPTAGVEMDVTSLMPMGFGAFHGPVAIGDVDDDGDLDLVVAEGAALHLATRTSTTFLDASGAMPATLDASVTRVFVVDVDGDCADDVVALASSGTVAALRPTMGSGLAVRAMQSGALDVAVGDFDGDGSREVALLGAGGRITLWQP